MPKITTVLEAQALRDHLIAHGQAWHKLLDSWRKVTDRRMDDDLKSFFAMLPPDAQKHAVASQSPLVEEEIQTLAAILASNKPEVSVYSRKAGREWAELAQEAEPVIEALYASLNPIELRMRAYVAQLGEVCMEFVDLLPVPEALAGYADRKSLESGAETPADALDDSPQANYRRAYEKTGDHDQAYNEVTRGATSGSRWTKRVVDIASAHWEEDTEDNVIKTVCLATTTALAAAMSTLEGYGVKREGNVLMMTRSGKSVGESPLTAESAPYEGIGTASVDGVESVTVTELRTREQHCLLVEGVPGNRGDDGSGILITFNSPFPARLKTCGAYITPSREKARGSLADRYEPYVLPLIVTVQQLNAVMSVKQALAYAEAARDVITEMVDNPIPPIEATTTAKSKQVKDGKLPVSVRGRVVRIPTTDVDLTKMSEELRAEAEGFRSREFFSGSGSSSEPALHLARIQAAELTRLEPQQSRRATTDKRQLIDILAAQAELGESLVLYQTPSGPPQDIEGRQLKELELTPEMARAPIVIETKIGSSTKEGEFARQQMTEAAVSFGWFGLSDGRERMGIKNPAETVLRMAKDALVRASLGTATEPGSAIIGLQKMIDERSKALIASLMPMEPEPLPSELPAEPILPSEIAQFGAGGAGGGAAYIPPPTQTVPNAPGPAGGVPASPMAP